MSWNEADHPRDEKGRFTFNGGGKDNSEAEKNYQYGDMFKLSAEVFDTYAQENKELPKDILYKQDKITKEQKAKENAYKDKLLDILGKFATHADVLYGTIKSLEKKIKDNGLEYRIKNIEDDKPIIQSATEWAIGEDYNKNYKIAEAMAGKNTAGMLDLAHGVDNMNNPDYIKDAIKLKNYDDPAVNQYKEYLKEKVSSQYKDYGFKAEDINGYFFKNNSEPSKSMAESEDFKRLIKEHKQDILLQKDFSISFPKHGPIGVMGDNNWRNAIGKADVKNIFIDEQGLHLRVFDTYDFNRSATDFLNKSGASQMEKGNLKPYFSIHDVLIPKSELVKIWE